MTFGNLEILIQTNEQCSTAYFDVMKPVLLKIGKPYEICPKYAMSLLNI